LFQEKVAYFEQLKKLKKASEFKNVVKKLFDELDE